MPPLRALATIVGGAEIPNDADCLPVEVLDQVVAAAPPVLPDVEADSPELYDAMAFTAARVILAAYRRWPVLRHLAMFSAANEVGLVTERGLDAVLLERLEGDDRAVLVGVSGFQYGWSVNCARRILGWDPIDNPCVTESWAETRQGPVPTPGGAETGPSSAG